MSGEYPFPSKIVSPAKCNEKPWDLWIGEIGRLSPRPDDEDAFVAPAPAETKGGGSRRLESSKRGARYRRSGLNRLRHDTMSLHGLFPQMDDLNAAVCHMCGVTVKCSAAYRHLLESHPGSDALLPPPPPAATLRSRSRHKKEQLPPSPVESLPVKLETSPAHAVTPPLSRIVLPPQELFLEEGTAAGGELQVCVESGELPVVSIQDPEELPLGENLTDDIFSIMNSEGIQSADDITNSADWKNIIRDIGNLQDLTFSQGDAAQTSELYAPLSSYSLPEPELPALQLPALPALQLPALQLPALQLPASTPPPAALDTAALHDRAPKPTTPTTPTAKSQSRSKSGKTKFNLREYDPNKHCGVLPAGGGKPCTRSLTCKAHALSLRRLVEGRAKPFDTLLAEHRASREAASAPQPPTAPAPPPPLQPLPPLLVNTTIDLSAFGALTADQQVDDIYATLLSVESTSAMLPDTSGITSLLSEPLAGEPFLPAEEMAPAAAPPAPAQPAVSPAARARREAAEEGGAAAADVCWYAACPRPLALCTYNARHAGGAVTLGKRYATVRSNIKSSLSRSQKAAGASNSFYHGRSALALSKSVHMNASKSNRPEVRKLIVTCSDSASEKVHQTLAELFGGEARAVNGHVGGGGGKARGHKAPLELAFSLDPLLADEKC